MHALQEVDEFEVNSFLKPSQRRNRISSSTSFGEQNHFKDSVDDKRNHDDFHEYNSKQSVNDNASENSDFDDNISAAKSDLEKSDFDENEGAAEYDSSGNTDIDDNKSAIVTSNNICDR